MDNANYARILQNMVEEAEENLALVEGSEKMFRGFAYKGPSPELLRRKAELREAMALVATLDPEHCKAPVAPEREIGGSMEYEAKLAAIVEKIGAIIESFDLGVLPHDITGRDYVMAILREAFPDSAKVCRWYEEEHAWVSTCGLEWVLEADSPSENQMAYCPKCGNPLVEDVLVDIEEGENE